MEQGIMGAEKQTVAVKEMDGVNRIAELAAQFVELRDRDLKVSAIGLSSVFRFMRYGRKAVSEAKEKARPNVRQHNNNERISGQGIRNGRSIGTSDISGNKPETHIEQLPVFLKGNRLREPIARVGKLRIVESEMTSLVSISPDSHEAINPPGNGRLSVRDSEGSQTASGKSIASRRKNTLWLTEQKEPTIAAPFYARKTRTWTERIGAMGMLRNEGESRVAYELRTSSNRGKSRSIELQDISPSSKVRAPRLLQSSSMLPAERGMIYRNNFMHSVKPISLKPNFSMDSSGLSNGGKSDKAQFDLPAESAAGKGRRGTGTNGHKRSQAVKVEINQPLIGSVTIQTSRGDVGVYELRSRIEGVLMDILESVNIIG